MTSAKTFLFETDPRPAWSPVAGRFAAALEVGLLEIGQTAPVGIPVTDIRRRLLRVMRFAQAELFQFLPGMTEQECGDVDLASGIVCALTSAVSRTIVDYWIAFACAR